MKKSILILCTVLATISLTAFGYISWSDTVTDQKETSISENFGFDYDLLKIINKQANLDLFYDVDSRYGSTFTKEDLDKVRSIADFLPKEQIESIMSFHSVSVTILDDNYGTVISEAGESDIFNAAQIKLLRTAPYSTNILIRAEFQEKNKETGQLEESYTTPHLTIVPEKEAKFTSGKEALIAYVKENTKELTSNIKESFLRPGKVSFTVTKEGEVDHVTLISTSGYPDLDKKLVDLVTNMPENWEPAENSKGEKVNQEFVFFFGTAGC